MAASYLYRFRLIGRDVRLFLVTTALVGFAWDGMRTVLFNLYLLRLGYGPEFVGLVSAGGALSFAFSSLLAGAIAARWTSRNALIAGVALLAIGSGLVPLAEFVPLAWRTAWLLVITVLVWMGLAAYFVASLPFLMGATGPEERSHAFSLFIALAPLTAFAGSLVGGLLPEMLAAWLEAPVQDPIAYRYPLWLSAILLVPGALVLLHTSQVSAGHDQTLSGDALRSGAQAVHSERPPYGLILIMALVVALRFAGRGPVGTFFNVYLDDGLGTSTVLIGALVAAGQLLSVPAALAVPPLEGQWGNGPLIIWGSLGMALGTLPLALIPHWTAAGLGFMGSTIMLSLSTGPVRVYSQEIVTRRWRTVMSGAIMAGSGLSYAAMSMWGGVAIATLGYRSIFMAGGALAALAAVVFWVYFRVPRGELACPAKE